MPYLGRSSQKAIRQRFIFTQSSAGATSVSGADDSNATLRFDDGEYIDVILNGITLAKTEYNTTTANTIGGLSALSSGDVLQVTVYDMFNVADAVSASTGGTFSGGLTVNGTLAATALTGDGSGLTGLTAVVKSLTTAQIARDTSQTTTSTSYVSTGATITIPAATVATLSKIVIQNNCSMRIDKNSHAHADIRIQRTAPSAANFDSIRVGIVAGGSEALMNCSTIAIDSSLGTGDHTYTVYVRKADGNTTYSGTIYYNYDGHRLVAIGV